MAAPDSATLISVNLAHVRPDQSEKYRHLDVRPNTGIDKQAAPGRVSIEPLGALGDTICDTENHGGLDQALYAYAAEDADWWQDRIGSQIAFTLHAGAFGENLTTRALDVTGALCGEQWQIGGPSGVVVQVTRPRIPCSTFAGFWGVPHLVKTFTEAGRPGAYLRVLRPGEIGADDRIEIIHRPDHDFTIGEMFRALTGDRSLAHKLIEVADVPADLKERAEAWV
jgi:MOSC domain-containing protein YiiM